MYEEMDVEMPVLKALHRQARVPFELSHFCRSFDYSRLYVWLLVILFFFKKEAFL